VEEIWSVLNALPRSRSGNIKEQRGLRALFEREYQGSRLVVGGDQLISGVYKAAIICGTERRSGHYDTALAVLW
jgi:hypothetical protein